MAHVWWKFALVWATVATLAINMFFAYTASGVGKKLACNICGNACGGLPGLRVNTIAVHSGKIDFLKEGDVNLNEYIEKCVYLSEEDRIKMSSYVNLLHKFLANDVNFSMKTYIKGGSLAKGTAIKWSSDIDVVVFLNDFKDTQDMYHVNTGRRNKMQNIIRKINRSLKKDFYATDIRSSKYFIELKIHGVKVDMLPAFDNLGSDYDYHLAEADDEKQKQVRYRVYEEMKDANREYIKYYSSCFTRLQTEFVKRQPTNVKDIIKLMKQWKNVYLKGINLKDGVPTSYPLELLTIHTWEQAGSPETFDIKIAFKSVLKNLVNYQELYVTWNTYYNYDEFKEGKVDERPFLLDPANPFNNIASRFKGWENVAAQAQKAMESNLLVRVATWN